MFLIRCWWEDKYIKQTVEYTSDASGKKITNHISVGVIYKGKHYTVDLDGDDIDTELDMITLKKVIDVGRQETSRPAKRKSVDAELQRRARLWALEKGMAVGQRGIVPQEIIDAYEKDLGHETASEE